MTKQEKAAAIEDLTAALKGLKNLYLTDISGLNASQISKKILDILFTKEAIKVVKN